MIEAESDCESGCKSDCKSDYVFINVGVQCGMKSEIHAHDMVVRRDDKMVGGFHRISIRLFLVRQRSSLQIEKQWQGCAEKNQPIQ